MSPRESKLWDARQGSLYFLCHLRILTPCPPVFQLFFLYLALIKSLFSLALTILRLLLPPTKGKWRHAVPDMKITSSTTLQLVSLSVIRYVNVLLFTLNGRYGIQVMFLFVIFSLSHISHVSLFIYSFMYLFIGAMYYRIKSTECHLSRSSKHTLPNYDAVMKVHQL